MFNKLRHSRAGFTLVELIMAMAILGIMSTMTLLIYFNISETSRRLQISRELSETARQITEKISQDVRQYGVSVSTTPVSTLSPAPKQDFLNDYTDKGSEILKIGTDNKKYFLY